MIYPPSSTSACKIPSDTDESGEPAKHKVGGGVFTPPSLSTVVEEDECMRTDEPPPAAARCTSYTHPALGSAQAESGVSVTDAAVERHELLLKALEAIPTVQAALRAAFALTHSDSPSVNLPPPTPSAQHINSSPHAILPQARLFPHRQSSILPPLDSDATMVEVMDTETNSKGKAKAQAQHPAPGRPINPQRITGLAIQLINGVSPGEVAGELLDEVEQASIGRSLIDQDQWNWECEDGYDFEDELMKFDDEVAGPSGSW